METYIGTILPFGFNFAPSNWMTCQGQVLQVNQYNAVYALLGNLYGGSPSVNFNLPDLQGRMPIGAGQGAGLTPRIQGQKSGTEGATLTIANLPPHNHPAAATMTSSGGIQVSTNTANNVNVPTNANNILSASGGGQGQATIWSNTLSGPVAMGGVNFGGSVAVTVDNTGGGIPISILNPVLALNFCIAIQGLWPPRD